MMSYFGQVRPSSLQRLWSGTFSTASEPATSASATASSQSPQESNQTSQQTPAQAQAQQEMESPSPSPSQDKPFQSASRGSSDDQGPPLLPHEKVHMLSESKPPPSQGAAVHAYPTPPTSGRSSLGAVTGEARSGEGVRQGAASSITPPATQKMSVTSRSSGLGARRPSLLTSSMSHPSISTMVSESTVTAHHFSNPGSRKTSISHVSPIHEQFTSVKDPEDPASVRSLKKLTPGSTSKSGQSTPNRSLSTAQPARNDGQEERRTSNESSSATGTQTPSGSAAAAAQVPVPKGRLTVKISEARGLRKCRVPYVVAVFQRSELISYGPRPEEESDEAAIMNVAMGGVPIQRQGSDSGRPMAIPMRSRQSSNTSIGEFNSFRTRPNRRSFTNPKWDAEAV